MIRFAGILLVAVGLSGCTTDRWRFDNWVPYGAQDEVDRQDLEQMAAAACPVTDLLTPHFSSDGCSMWPDGDWAGCCVAHDLAYWCGGTREARKAADQQLRACVNEVSSGLNAGMMYYGVRLGGHPLWPFPWRWGFGRRWRGGHWSVPEDPIPAAPLESWNAQGSGSPESEDRLSSIPARKR